MKNLLRDRLRVNSTFEHRYFSGGLPGYQHLLDLFLRRSTFYGGNVDVHGRFYPGDTGFGGAKRQAGQDIHVRAQPSLSPACLYYAARPVHIKMKLEQGIRTAPYIITPRCPEDIAICYTDATLAKTLLNWRAERFMDAMYADH